MSTFFRIRLQYEFNSIQAEEVLGLYEKLASASAMAFDHTEVLVSWFLQGHSGARVLSIAVDEFLPQEQDIILRTWVEFP